MHPTFSFVVPTVESVFTAFDGCIPSLLEYEGRRHEIILVDDGSDAGARDEARRRCDTYGIRFLHHARNIGYPGTVNRGIRVASGDVVILLNSDVRFVRPVTGPIAEILDRRPEVGAVGGLLLYPDGRIQHGGMVYTRGAFGHRGHGELPATSEAARKPGPMLGCTGALLALRRGMIDEIGLLDESLTQACDDIEYCLRVWSRGWEVYYSPEVRAVHEEGGTRGRTLLEKLRRSAKWTYRELRTYRRFHKVLAEIDLAAIERRVSVAQANGG